MTATTQLRPTSRLEDLAVRLERLELSDPASVQLAIGSFCATSRAVAAIGCWLGGVTWLVIVNSLSVLFYATLILHRHRAGHFPFFIGAIGVEAALWGLVHMVAFGVFCSFQLHTLVLLPTYVLLFHGITPRKRLILLVTPLLVYSPVAVFWPFEPLSQLSLEVQRRLAVANEIAVTASVIMVAGAALLQHVRGRRVAEQREAAQARLVEDLSHELRTPLATLLTLAQGARIRDHDTQRLAERLGWVEESAREAGRLVERLLDLAALEHDRGERGPTAPLSQVARGVAERVRTVAEPRGIAIDFDEQDPCETLVDVASLEVVLRNLLVNAIAHSPDGARVEMRVRRDEDRTRIDVEDHGEGIAPEHLPLIFDRLWRADPARSRTEGRFGLGLSIAKRHAELLGARMTVRSQLGVGSVFSLVFDGARSADALLIRSTYEGI